MLNVQLEVTLKVVKTEIVEGKDYSAAADCSLTTKKTGI